MEKSKADDWEKAIWAGFCIPNENIMNKKIISFPTNVWNYFCLSETLKLFVMNLLSTYYNLISHL